jgi:hypothetical protein
VSACDDSAVSLDTSCLHIALEQHNLLRTSRWTGTISSGIAPLSCVVAGDRALHRSSCGNRGGSVRAKKDRRATQAGDEICAASG